MDFHDFAGGRGPVESGNRPVMLFVYGGFFDPKTGLVNPVADLDELGVLLEVAALRGHMFAANANLAVCAAVDGERSESYSLLEVAEAT